MKFSFLRVRSCFRPFLQVHHYSTRRANAHVLSAFATGECHPNFRSAHFEAPKTTLRSNHLFSQITNNFFDQKRFAGHSKWQNIRHTKAANDAAKSKIFAKVCTAIRKAVMHGGGQTDPKVNDRLAAALAEARRQQVPSTTIDRTIEKAKNKKLKPYQIEILAPGGAMVLVDGETPNISQTIHDVKYVCKKCNCAYITDGRAKGIFDQKGVITLGKGKDGSELTFDMAEELAIEAEGENVVESVDGDGNPCFQVICSQDAFYKVKKHLEDSSYTVSYASLEYFPKILVPLNEEQRQVLDTLCKMLEELDDVDGVYVSGE